MITHGAMKKAARTYDVEVIQRLEMPSMGLNKICNLETCLLLVELSLPHNEIRKMEGLDALVKLEILDLSCNQITKVGNLGTLESLESLDLRGNKISDCDDLQGLGLAKGLKRLYLQFSNAKTPAEKLPNPVCAQAPYFGAVTRCAPGVEFLDGESLVLRGKFLGPDGLGAAPLEADKKYSEKLPLEPWFSKEDLKIPPPPAMSAETKAAIGDFQADVRECIALHAEGEKMIAEALKAAGLDP